jgi:hypothetical protein
MLGIPGLVSAEHKQTAKNTCTSSNNMPITGPASLPQFVLCPVSFMSLRLPDPDRSALSDYNCPDPDIALEPDDFGRSSGKSCLCGAAAFTAGSVTRVSGLDP